MNDFTPIRPFKVPPVPEDHSSLVELIRHKHSEVAGMIDMLEHMKRVVSNAELELVQLENKLIRQSREG